jgi:4-nitrophenyl phosphatase
MPGFLIDLDGTMYAGNEPIEHAAAFIRHLRAAEHPYLFVTNNSSRTPEEVAAHLREIAAVEAGPEDVMTSSQAAARYIADLNEGRRVWFIGENGLETALREAGMIITADEPDYVVQGIDRSFTYEKLAAAVGMIRAGAKYILTNPDHLLPSGGGLMPGAGSIAAAIRTASMSEPVIIGKPSPVIMDQAAERLGLAAQDIWVVGDNLRTDISGGMAAGCRTALVLTGLVTEHNAEQQIAETGIRPDLVCRHLMELPERLGL